MQTQSLSNDQLVVLFQSSFDQQYFGEIYQRFHRKVFALCLSYSKDRQTADDLMQDVMIKVYENLPKLKNPELLGVWVNRIAKNYCIDFCQSNQQKYSGGIEEYHHLEAEETDVESLQKKDQVYEMLPVLLSSMRVEDQLLLQLKYFQNYSIEDLQKELQLSESAVKMRLSRARKRMQKLFAEKQLAFA